LRDAPEGHLGLSYEIVYAPIALKHLRGLDARQRALVVDTVDQQLCHQPEIPTRNRKRLRPNPLAPWELRIGDIRVFYAVELGPLCGTVDEEAATDGQVFVLSVGIKRGNRVLIENEEFEL
jgi:mRNA-degrading endonuclease RelE of RelBE toxin-antitoxin system